MSANLKSQSHIASPIGEDGKVRCYAHNMEALLLTSRTPENPNRKFYCCPKDRSDPERCKFFCWADDPMFKRHNQMTSSPQRQKASQAPFEPLTPKKRASSPSSFPDSTPPTPSQIRLAQMQAALSQTPGASQSSQRLSPKSYVSSTQSSWPSQGQSVIASSPPMQSHSQLDDIEAEDDSFFSSPLSSGSSVKPARTSEYQFPLDYRAPKRARVGDHAEDETDLMSRQSPRHQGGLSTPPETPSKQRNGDGGTNSQWQKIQSDRHNPFHERAASLREHLQSQQPVSAGTRSLEDPSINELAEPTANSISALLHGLSNVPAYISKLELKKVAAEKSTEAKTKRIAQLEDEVHMLRRKNRVLEESIETLRVKRL